MTSSIIFLIVAVSGVSALGFLLGLSRNIKIDRQKADQSAMAYDANIVIEDLIVSSDQFCAIANTNKGLLLLKSVGLNVSARLINTSQIKQDGENIKFQMNDIGYPDFSAQFVKADIASLVSKRLKGEINA